MRFIEIPLTIDAMRHILMLCAVGKCCNFCSMCRMGIWLIESFQLFMRTAVNKWLQIFSCKISLRENILSK